MVDKNNCVNAVRILSIDQVQKANSGHPGAPLGASPMCYELWSNHMNFNPDIPKWINRDRFVLSAGHASAMQYALLHLFGYDLTIEDLKNFRQLDSLTPGHPEYNHTPGIECTTGPLGAGFAMGVGMAIAQNHLASIFNRDDYNVIDNYTYIYSGDGCLMEGITSEASSLAGTLGLDRLIVLYDSNNITIEGSTDYAFSENVKDRYLSYNWQVLEVEDGNNLDEIGKAIKNAKKEKNKPSIIIVKTQIGYGCPAKQGTSSAHGEPLGEENVKTTRQTLNWKEEEPFKVSEEIYEEFSKIKEEKISKYNLWNEKLESYFSKYPDMKKIWDIYFNTKTEDLINKKDLFTKKDGQEATRASSGDALQKIKDMVPNLIGGSADLAPSNKTEMKGVDFISKKDFSGRNIHYGVRELAMAGIGNGILAYGGLKTYIATFFVFSDYTKPMLRLSSMMQVPLISIFTHDSIGVGEDGATHQPIEQATMLRSLPNFYTFRPADYIETACGWYLGLTNEKAPTALLLTRQNLPQLQETSTEALKGGYILQDSQKNIPDGIIIATGSEVHLALEAREQLLKENLDVRVVSMPCMELFDEQSDEYKEKILPSNVSKRVSVEALSTLSWYKYVGLKGKAIGIDSFGSSAPANQLFEKYGITVENIVKTFKSL